MVIGVFEGEKKVSQIVRKVFGDLAKPEAALAEAALLRANPQLKAIDRVAKGTLIVIPAIPGLRPRRFPRPRPGREEPEGPHRLLAAVREAVKQFGDDVEKNGKMQVEQGQAALKILAAARSRELADDIARVTKATQDRLEATEARMKVTREVLKQIEKDLDAFGARLP